MKMHLICIALFLLGLCLSAGNAAPAGKNDGAYLHDVRSVVETPHLSWLKPSAKGKPKVLFLARRPGIYGRTIVELAQRMDIDYTAYLLAPDKQERDYWESNIDRSLTGEKEQEAIDKLSLPYDAIVLINFDVSWLPKQAQYYLLRQVQGGAGLVAADCGAPWTVTPAADDPAAITAGVPLSALPAYTAPTALRNYGAVKWQDMPARLVQTGTLQRGRVAVIHPLGFGYEPEDEVYCNYHYALFIHALQWATPALQPDFAFSALPEGSAYERAALPKLDLPVKITSALKANATLTLATAIRNPLGDEEAIGEQPLTLAPGENDVKLLLPALPADVHFYDLWLKSANGVEQFGSFAFTVNATDTVAEVSFDNAFHPAGDTAALVKVKFSQALTAPAQLRLTATDTYGRQVASQTVAVNRGAAEAQTRLSLGLVVALAQWVRADLLRDGETLSSKQALLVVRRTEPGEFPSLLWGGIESGLDGLHQLRRQREAGFNIAYVGPSADGSSARFAALADFQFASYACRVDGVSNGKDGKITNAAFMQKWVKDTVDNHRASAPYGIYVYSVGDECFLGGADQPFAPSDVAAFHDYLKAQYGTLTELNRVWQTQYATFEDIQPVEWGKAIDTKLYPQKHDRLAFIESLYARAMREFDAGFKTLDPAARVGAEGSEPGDLEETLHGMTMWGPYSDRRIDVLLASLAPRSLVRGMWWGGYHGGTLDRPASVKQFWRQVFEGVCNTNFFFDGIIGHHESNVASDLSWADYFEQMLPELHAIYETPGPLIAGATYKDNGVALLWSQPSEHAGLFYAPFCPPAQEMLAQFAALDANGVNYRFVTARQLEADGLDPKAVKLLLLPATTAVSPRLAEALNRYVQAGGVLLADGSAGQMDGHCALQATGELDSLFGVKRLGAPKVVAVDAQAAGTLLGAALTMKVPGVTADTMLRADGAEVALAAGDVPLLTVKPVGKGKAVFLNGTVAELVSRGEQGLASGKSLIAALLQAAGVHPLFAVEPLGALRVYSHQLGKVTLLSVVRKDEKAASSIHLTEPAWVYDCLNRKSLGKTDSITLPQQSNGFELYTLASSELKAPTLKTPATAQRGQPAKLTLDLPNGTGRVVRLDAYRPDGAWVRVYRRFLTLTNPRAEMTIPFAVNDTPGEWTVSVTDLASGLREEKRMMVK